ISFQDLYTVTAYPFIRPNSQYNELLRRLSEKYKLAIMTNGSSDFQREKLKRTEVDTYIHKDYIFISEEMGYSKPSPQIYQTALTRMQMNAADVLFVGDSIGNDILGPKNAGM